MTKKQHKAKNKAHGGGVLHCHTSCILALFGLFGLVIGDMVGPKPASALTYSSDVGISFTFNSMIQVNLSSADLHIDDLAPGDAADSNIITVGATTNAAYGYQLSATVGVKNGTDALVNASDNTKTFANLTSNKAGLANFEDNTWGYSYCADTAVNCGAGGSATWVSGSVGSATAGYNGLPLDNNDSASERGQGGVTLISTENTADSTQSVQFKIGAKASNAQAAGEYTNTINFYAVANPEPMTLAASYAAAHKTQMNGYYKLQDMDTSICSAVEVVDDELQVIDTRDGKVYWIAKLADGHCWMTQNLDLDLGATTLTHNSTTLYHDDTDLGWGTDTATTSWTPDRATIAWDGSAFSGWTNDNNHPYSTNPGDWYYAGYDGTTLLTSTTVDYLTSTNKVTDAGVTTVYNDANHTTAYFKSAPFTGPGTSNNGTHGHVGNYYNWSAAVASNDTSAYQSNTSSDITSNPQNSICPKGWRLPVITSYSASSAGTNEFANLNYYYNNKVTNTSAGWEASPLFFTRGGNVHTSSLNTPGNTAYYWSSSVYDNTLAYFLYFLATYVSPTNYTNRYHGFPIRCVAR